MKALLLRDGSHSPSGRRCGRRTGDPVGFSETVSCPGGRRPMSYSRSSPDAGCPSRRRGPGREAHREGGGEGVAHPPSDDGDPSEGIRDCGDSRPGSGPERRLTPDEKRRFSPQATPPTTRPTTGTSPRARSSSGSIPEGRPTASSFPDGQELQPGCAPIRRSSLWGYHNQESNCRARGHEGQLTLGLTKDGKTLRQPQQDAPVWTSLRGQTFRTIELSG